MNLWERIKRFWLPSARPDHPLTEEERGQVPPDTVYGELSNTAVELANHADPDVTRRPVR